MSAPDGERYADERTHVEHLVTVVIPNWNGHRHLPECIGSLREQTFGLFRITVVDNASQDGSVQWLRETAPEVGVVELPENGGFAVAVNVGIEDAETPYVALLNNDVRLEAGWLGALVDALERRPDYDVAASLMLMYCDPEKVNAAGDVYDLKEAVGCNRGFGEPVERFSEPRRVLGACAGAALYRRSVFDQVGLFDERFFVTFEDTDWNLRALIAGRKALFVPGARVYHKIRSSIDAQPPRWMEELERRNRAIVVSKDLPGVLRMRVVGRWVAKQARPAIRTAIPLRPKDWRLIPGGLRRVKEKYAPEIKGFAMGKELRQEVWARQAIPTREILRWLENGVGDP